jgi:anti-anti-sigma factor
MDIEIRRTTDEAGRAVVTVSGAIDMQSREALSSAARAALQDKPSGLVLDLSAVTFMDSTGIGTLIELGHDAEDASAELVIRDPSPRVVRILEMTGLDSAWPMEQSA